MEFGSRISDELPAPALTVASRWRQLLFVAYHGPLAFALRCLSINLSVRVQHHADDVFLDSIKHGYMDVADEAGQIVIADRGMSRYISRVLNARWLSTWDRYSEYYRSQFDVYYVEPPPFLHRGGVNFCSTTGHNSSLEIQPDT
ncbi:hypothetical protein CPC08DRAFT_724211 [Agrocybe pediades]|nr:hypothetical protein CPC08DRAFT_724211 [Agrocybe pediades]